MQVTAFFLSDTGDLEMEIFATEWKDTRDQALFLSRLYNPRK
jgi:hypothetical protein